jgi:hypothetical protein
MYLSTVYYIDILKKRYRRIRIRYGSTEQQWEVWKVNSPLYHSCIIVFIYKVKICFDLFTFNTTIEWKSTSTKHNPSPSSSYLPYKSRTTTMGNGQWEPRRQQSASAHRIRLIHLAPSWNCHVTTIQHTIYVCMYRVGILCSLYLIVDSWIERKAYTIHLLQFIFGN